MSFIRRLFGAKEKEHLTKGLERTKQGFLAKIGKSILGKSVVDEEVLDQLEEALLTADVGIDTTLAVIERIKKKASSDKYLNINELNNILQSEMEAMLQPESASPSWGFSLAGAPKPMVILVVGVNGVGKTTTIAKLAYQFKQAGKSVLIGAADTFRAAAVEQLVIWSERVGVPIVHQSMGADPSAVAFDTVQQGKTKKADVILIDTAGRLHNKVHLMEELSKIKRVIHKIIPEAPHEVLLVLDGATGQNALVQAKQFIQATEVTGLVVTKLDGTAKGGAVLAISHQLHIPVRFIGVGETMQDLLPFDAHEFVDSLFSLDKNN